MNVKKQLYIAIAAGVFAMSVTSCGVYKKYETPQNTALTKAYVDARDNGAANDSTAFGNLLWEQVFTDPVLADLINRALVNNTDLKDAKLNVDIARTQLKGVRLAYLPSVALSPYGSGSSMAGSDLSWSYNIPAS